MPNHQLCSICHETITKETLPTHRAGVRIFHDDPKRWKTEYAKVYRKDPAFCAHCHDEPFDSGNKREHH